MLTPEKVPEGNAEAFVDHDHGTWALVGARLHSVKVTVLNSPVIGSVEFRLSASVTGPRVSIMHVPCKLVLLMCISPFMVTVVDVDAFLHVESVLY
jgi:hypothetical protein